MHLPVKCHLFSKSVFYLSNVPNCAIYSINYSNYQLSTVPKCIYLAKGIHWGILPCSLSLELFSIMCPFNCSKVSHSISYSLQSCSLTVLSRNCLQATMLFQITFFHVSYPRICPEISTSDFHYNQFCHLFYLWIHTCPNHGGHITLYLFIFSYAHDIHFTVPLLSALIWY